MEKDDTALLQANAIQFERLITDISAHFIRLPLEGINDGIIDGLCKIRDFFEADEVFLLKYTQNWGLLERISSGSSEHANAIPLQMDRNELFPWIISRIRKQEIVNVHYIGRDATGGRDRHTIIKTVRYSLIFCRSHPDFQ